MVPSLLLLSASLVASPVIVSEVKATREAGHLRVEVRADGGIDPEAARTRIDQGSLFLFLGGARVKADNRAWKLDQGVGEIRAHRHHTETELDVPLTGNGCSGPVELEGTPTGLTALVGCDGAPAAVPAPAVAPVVVKEKPAAKAAAPAPVKEIAPAAPAKEVVKAAPAATKPAAPAPAEAVALKNLVALPPAEDDVAADPPPVAAKSAVAKDDDKATAPEAVAKETAPARVETKAAPSEKQAPALELPAPADLPAKAASIAPSGLRAVGLPALFLAALAVAAYVFARKKRGLGQRRIEILETASLGPKRSLVIARVGDETLVLGSSEAGITLLQISGEVTVQAKPTVEPPSTFASVADAVSSAKPVVNEGRSELDQPLVEALADVPEPEGIMPTGRGSFRSIEGGLASLFGRKAAATAAARVEPKGGTTFDDLLEDSVEDQELRRKLAAGMSARVR